MDKLLSDTQKFLQQQIELYGDYFLSQKINNDTNYDVHINKIENIVAEAKETYNAVQVKLENEDLMKKEKVEKWSSAKSINELNDLINSCSKCSLHKTRNKFVFGVGNAKPEVVVVGEAPGADEDEQGEPFVGRGGQLLNKILEAVKFKREDVFICNILKCRPHNNRDPLPEEVNLCEPYLWKQLELLNPKIILCVGRIAGQTLLKTNSSLTELRGKTHNYRGIPLIITYHPAALLRNPNWKKPCWEDMQMFRKLYEEISGK